MPRNFWRVLTVVIFRQAERGLNRDEVRQELVNVVFEERAAADKLRKNLEPSDYKHVALGLITARTPSRRAAEDPDVSIGVEKGPPIGMEKGPLLIVGSGSSPESIGGTRA